MSYTTPAVEPGHRSDSVISKVLNILVTPGDVFDQVIAMRFRQSTWILPTLLVCLTGLFLVVVGKTPEQTSAAGGGLVEASSSISASQAETLIRHWTPISLVLVGVVPLIGTFWSATIVWAMGRFLLRARFRFSQALAVVALTGTILALGSLVTGLLVLAAGNGAVRPGMSVFLPRLSPESSIVLASGVFNIFNLWSTAVLGIGLSRLAKVSLKEALFWVFGWWFILRLGLILLA